MKIARVRIIKHEAVPRCGSFEVRFADGRDSIISIGMAPRRLEPETLDRETALTEAKAVARSVRASLE